MAGESITWIDPMGVSHLLDGSLGVTALIGEQGQYYPPLMNLDQRTPLQPGSLVRYVDVLPRVMTYPLQVQAASEMALRTLIRNLTGWFNTTRLPGTLVATAPDGVSQRQATCYYVAGLEGDGSEANRKPGNIVFPLQLLANDPFWYDMLYTVVNVASASPPFLSSQFLPLQLAGTSVFGDFSITNNGDFETWPIWQIQGPVSNILLTNLSTNKQLALTANGGLVLAANQILTIDKSFGVKTIKTQDGASQAQYRQPQSQMWSLATGLNVISVQATGTTSQTTVRIQYRQRYLSQ